MTISIRVDVKPREKTGPFPLNSNIPPLTDFGRRTGWYHWITLKSIDISQVGRHEDLIDLTISSSG